MSISSLLAPLSRVGLFRGLSPLQLSEVARRAEPVTFHAGEVIVAAGEEPDGALLILDGPVARVEDEQRLVDVQPGALLSEMAAVVEIEAAYTFVARSEVRALKILRAQMLEQLADDPAVAERLLSTIAGRLSDLALDLRRVERLLPEAPAAAGATPPSAGLDDDAHVGPAGALLRDHQTEAQPVRH